MTQFSDILSRAEQDVFFEGIVQDITRVGYHISRPLFSGAGGYTPQMVASENIDLIKEGLKQYPNPIKFHFSRWLGVEVVAHYALHELMHFYQDSIGLYFTPLHSPQKPSVMLDAVSTVKAILFCEAWAETEAIRASWRIKEDHGDGLFWKGVLRSPDWGDLALAYEGYLQSGEEELRAAAAIFQEWYQGPHIKFYEEQALKYFQVLLRCCQSGGNDNYFRNLTASYLYQKVTDTRNVSFFCFVDFEALFAREIQSKNVRNIISTGGKLYEKAASESVSDIENGSVAFLSRAS